MVLGTDASQKGMVREAFRATPGESVRFAIASGCWMHESRAKPGARENQRQGGVFLDDNFRTSPLDLAPPS